MTTYHMYRLRPGFHHFEGPDMLEPGALVKMGEERARAMAERFELTTEPVPPDNPTFEQVTGSTMLEFLKNDSSIVLSVVSGLGDTDDLDALLREEIKGQARKDVLTAVAHRLDRSAQHGT